MEALTAEGVSFRYEPGPPVLRDVSLRVEKGEFLSLIGPNGSGKTTFLRLLDRIYVPQQGEIRLGGKPLAKYTRSDIARRIAFVPQESSLHFQFTVFEMVLMGRSPHTRGMVFENARDREIALNTMKLTDIAHLSGQPITALSGGERQRVYIARALTQEPEILLLDEPNAHLDIAHQIDIFSIIKRLNTESGLTVLSVSHDLNLASSYSDRIAMFTNGTLAAIGRPEDVLSEDRIRKVFNTNVVVDTHPRGKVPRVTLLP